ncbi:hypothetical protein B0J14DRAFT_507528 [Halenospora varia]|nr:hypothetical protein B0J14DRAFT_507528 [Halenospora varia]
MLPLSLLSYCFLSLLSPFSYAAPSPHSVPTVTRRAAAPQSTACGDVVRSSSKVSFNASLVYECLTSVPFNSAVATKFLKYYKDSVQFHSTLSYLKAPPAGYQQQPIDLIAGIDQIQARISAGSFANQYEFEAALQTLIQKCHDAHLDLTFGILGVVSFGTSYRILSISEDGKKLPKIFLSSDVFLSGQPGNTWKPSAVTKLNGIDVIDYLSQFAAKNAFGGLEPHTDWNQLMGSPALAIQGIPTIWGGGATFYPGDKLTFLLENGTQFTTRWYGTFHGDSETGPLETGADFYNSFVLGLLPASYEAEVSKRNRHNEMPTHKTKRAASAPRTSWNNGAYPPKADIIQPNFGSGGGAFLSGYFLKEVSVAVLSIPSFQERGDAIKTHSDTVAKFISSSKAAGMKKIVIDLQQNYGGDALLAYNTFKQFFPDKEPYAGSQLRTHPPANIMGKTLTNYWKTLDEKDDDYYFLYTDEFMASTRLNVGTNQNFTSWEEFYGSKEFTTPQRYNLSDYVFDTISLGASNGYTVYGYGNNKVTTTQQYAASDIIILTDGLCSSTCAIFLEMMHHEAGVRTVVVGGRPSYGPMQAAGLSRGARAYGLQSNLDKDILNTQLILEFNKQPSSFLPNRASALDVQVLSSSINIRDQVRPSSTVPLQFTYDAATCRIFFTPNTVTNYAALWTYAAKAMWNDSSLCVKDSTGYSTSSETDTRLPPPSTVPLPATSVVVDDSKAYAETIMKVMGFGSGTGIQAAPISEFSVAAKAAAVPKPAADCTSRLCKDLMGNNNFYCDINYKTCINGVKSAYWGCVKKCPRYYVNAGPGTGGCPSDATCENQEDNNGEELTQLDYTNRGFCKSKTSSNPFTKFSCGEVKTTVKPTKIKPAKE